MRDSVVSVKYLSGRDTSTTFNPCTAIVSAMLFPVDMMDISLDVVYMMIMDASFHASISTPPSAHAITLTNTSTSTSNKCPFSLVFLLHVNGSHQLHVPIIRNVDTCQGRHMALDSMQIYKQIWTRKCKIMMDVYQSKGRKVWLQAIV